MLRGFRSRARVAPAMFSAAFPIRYPYCTAFAGRHTPQRLHRLHVTQCASWPNGAAKTLRVRTRHDVRTRTNSPPVKSTSVTLPFLLEMSTTYASSTALLICRLWQKS